MGLFWILGVRDQQQGSETRAIGRASDLRFTGRGFESLLGIIAQWPWTSYLHLCASVTKQYDLVPAKRVDLFGRESNRGPGGK